MEESLLPFGEMPKLSLMWLYGEGQGV